MAVYYTSGGQNYRQYSLRLPMEEWRDWVGLSDLENTGMVRPPQVVTDARINLARASLTLLIWPMLLPVCQARHLGILC